MIDKLYEDLKTHKDLLGIWTLLDHTGARVSEIRMLLVSEVIVDDPIPHIIIQPRADRTLKSKWSKRKVPLVGAAAFSNPEQLMAALSFDGSATTFNIDLDGQNKLVTVQSDEELEEEDFLF